MPSKGSGLFSTGKILTSQSHDVLIPALTLPDCWWLGKCGRPQTPGAALYITPFCIVSFSFIFEAKLKFIKEGF